MSIRIAAPETAKQGEIIEIKTMIQHTMESGFRRGSRGEVIPRDIITRFECHYNGALVFSADLFPAMSANPLISFFLRAETSGTLAFKWTDQHGQSWSETRDISVS